MKIDIVIPNNNEEKFIEIAKMLHFDNLIFIYKINKAEEIKNIKNKLKKFNNAKFGLLLNSKNIKDIKEGIKVIKAEENIRPIIEQNKNIIKTR